MAYNELIKKFNRTRDYMREFYIYGFKSREEYTRKSARSYDDERRRIEAWLGDYMGFRQTADGKNVFLSIDSRQSRHNPFYRAWKMKSFTDGEITMHFILMDILACAEEELSLAQITTKVDAYLAEFETPRLFDESTLRKKLKDYEKEGIVSSRKKGKLVYYRLAQSCVMEKCLTESLSVESPSGDFVKGTQEYLDLLDFFSEVAPCGVIGSYLIDRAEENRECSSSANIRERKECGERDGESEKNGNRGNDSHVEHFVFKHHYITSAMDSEILGELFLAMREKKNITLETINRNRDRIAENHVVPLQIMISVQSGRQYLMAYMPRLKRIASVRIDSIVSVKINDRNPRFEELRERLRAMQPHMWGVSTQERSGQRLEHVEFTVCYGEGEQHIHRRLEREKRCGTVRKLDEHTSHFSADVYDASELIPWIRTFLCRITQIHFSDPRLEAQFKRDIEEMYRLYGLEEGDKEIRDCWRDQTEMMDTERREGNRVCPQIGEYLEREGEGR